MIRFDHVSKHYGDRTAVNDLNLEIKAGEVFGFLGPNGAGKTSTLKMLNALKTGLLFGLVLDALKLAG